MGFETHRGKLYYYRKRREGGRVVSEYVGGGGAAALCAMLDAEGREEKADERGAILAPRARAEALDELLDVIGGALRAGAAYEMIAAGCHNHRGQWRVLRGKG
jgi:hypothetical protein